MDLTERLPFQNKYLRKSKVVNSPIGTDNHLIHCFCADSNFGAYQDDSFIANLQV